MLLELRNSLSSLRIEYDKIDKVRGMDVIFVTTANTDEEARELLTLFNMPFSNNLGGRFHGKDFNED